MNIEKCLMEINALQKIIRECKEKEMDLRTKVVNKLLENDQSTGTHKFNYPDFSVKIKTSNNIRIDHSTLSRIEQKLTPAELQCIRWKPELSLREYNSISGNHKLLDSVLTVTPAAPVIEFIFKD